MEHNNSISAETLKKDDEILKQMQKLASQGQQNSPEYQKLSQKYYVDNDYIRRYWKSY